MPLMDYFISTQGKGTTIVGPLGDIVAVASTPEWAKLICDRLNAAIGRR